jgi:hypothetical protein
MRPRARQPNPSLAGFLDVVAANAVPTPHWSFTPRIVFWRDAEPPTHAGAMADYCFLSGSGGPLLPLAAATFGGPCCHDFMFSGYRAHKMPFSSGAP